MVLNFAFCLIFAIFFNVGCFTRENPEVSRSSELLIRGITLSHGQKNFLIEEHNKYRRTVQSTYMYELKWDAKLEATAQNYAQQCILAHSQYLASGLGENIWAAPFSDFSQAVKLFFDEVFDRQCGCSNAFKPCCGHYTQVVNANTKRLGCGLAQCRGLQNSMWRKFILVCHYDPPGNEIYFFGDGKALATPAFSYATATEPQCSKCPKIHNATTCENGLCRWH